jgi:hypothetical protein
MIKNSGSDRQSQNCSKPVTKFMSTHELEDLTYVQYIQLVVQIKSGQTSVRPISADNSPQLWRLDFLSV